MASQYAIRDLSPEDYPACSELLSDPIYGRLFVTTDLAELHTVCSYAAVAESITDNEICAILMVAPLPQFYQDLSPEQQPASAPGTKVPSYWVDYVDQVYNCETSEFVTSWVRMAYCSPEHSIAMSVLVQGYFNYDPYHENLLLLSHPFTSPPPYLRKIFPELASEVPVSSNMCHIMCCLRSDVLPPLSVRNADMRDHDDLVAIFESQNTSVRARFGEFFIAGLITSASAEPDQKMSLVALDYESYALEYRANEANAIRKPVSFLYVERYNPQSSDDTKTIENLKKSHCLEKYSLHKIPHEDIGFIRATATLPIAESRCGELISAVFEQWPTLEAILLTLPSAATCTDMQMLRLFTLIDPRSPLSPRESLFMCHRDAWLGTVTIRRVRDLSLLEEARKYLEGTLKQDTPIVNISSTIHKELESLTPQASFGTIIACNVVGDRQVPIAVCILDMNIANQDLPEAMSDYLQAYHLTLRGTTSSCEVPWELNQTDSIWMPSLCLGSAPWCTMHYDEDLSKHAYLKAFIIDPLFLQYKDVILNSCMRVAGVDGFLLSIGSTLQTSIRRVYDAGTGEFQQIDCDTNTILTSFEKELLRTSKYVPAVTLLPSERDEHVIKSAVRKHFDGSLPTGHPEKSAERLQDEVRFNSVMQEDLSSEIKASALRVLNPCFSLFALCPSDLIHHFAPPLTIANTTEPPSIIIKPPVTFTDRLVLVGGGLGLISTLTTMHDCADLARFKNIVVVSPPPGIVTPYVIEYDKSEYSLCFDHGESLPAIRDRAIHLLYDVYIGEILELSLDDGLLKLASGAEFGFDIIMLCPEGSDAESFRLVPSFNLNSAASFAYGIVDPSGASGAGQLSQLQSNTLNTRGFKDQDIIPILSQAKSYSSLLSCMINERIMEGSSSSKEMTYYEQLLAPRLNSRLFMRYLTRDDPLSKRQMSALYNSTLTANLNTCVNFLYSPYILKQLNAKSGNSTNNKEDENAITSSAATNITKGTAQQPSGEEEQKPTSQLGPYRLLSPYAKSSQIIQASSPSAMLELPLLCKRLAAITNEARDQLFPSLTQEKPAKGVKGQTAAPTTTASVVDAARVSVAVVGDTFESFSIVRCLLDSGVAPSSIFLLIPLDPTVNVDQTETRNEVMIDNLVAPPGYGQYAIRSNSIMPMDPTKRVTMRQSEMAARGVSDNSTSQSAEKRSESFPRDLHAYILEEMNKLGINILKNIRILDVLCSLNGLSTKGFGKMPGYGNEEDDSDEEDEYSDESDEDETRDYDVGDSNLSDSDSEGSDNDTESLDENKLVAMVKEIRETLEELDAADISLNSRIPNFAEELEELDDVCDALLLGDINGVLVQYLAEGDSEFDPSVMDANEQRFEIFRILKKRLHKLQHDAKKTLSKKKRYRKKLFLGASLCGLRLGLQTNTAFNPDGEMSSAYGDDLPGSIFLNAGAMTRIITGPTGSIARMQISNSEPSPQMGSLDIHVCAVFLTEGFGVPFHYASALMRSDLVFDKALIVNSNAQASDPRVYAACNLGKISRATLLRRMQRSTNTANYLSAMKIPMAPHALTADPIKPVVDWSLFSASESARYAVYRLLSKRLLDFEVLDDDGLVPEFTNPLILNCRVINGHVFRVSRPLRDVRDLSLTVEKYFRVVETGKLCKLEKGERWCHLEVDPFGVVDNITVFSEQELHPDIKDTLYRIVGLPSALLNNLEGRWARGEVVDLIEFFSRPQVQVLLSDAMRTTIGEIVSDILTSQNFQDIMDKVWLGEYVGDDARSVGDISAEALQPSFGKELLKGSANGSRAIEILMMISKQLMEEAKGRFPELGEGAGVRGKVTFTPLAQ